MSMHNGEYQEKHSMKVWLDYSNTWQAWSAREMNSKYTDNNVERWRDSIEISKVFKYQL